MTLDNRLHWKRVRNLALVGAIAFNPISLGIDGFLPTKADATYVPQDHCRELVTKQLDRTNDYLGQMTVAPYETHVNSCDRVCGDFLIYSL